MKLYKSQFDMEKVIYSKKGGLGIILKSEEKESDFFIDKSFVINGVIIKPDDFTDLFGLFTEPVRYVGVLKGDENCMVFCLGSDGDLFGLNIYYSCLYWISESRIVNIYKENTVRDFNWIDGRWK